ncbi:MAG: MFS transporter [Thermoleophilia bacterium]|nr:MFS transporter [Thermoleophilia bacterium]
MVNPREAIYGGAVPREIFMEDAINTSRNRYIALSVLCAGIFLAAIDQTVVVTVLPRIIDDLEGGFSPAGVERAGWIITAYLFGFAVVLPLMGRVADLYGHRRTYGLAMVIFALGSLLCAFSDSLYALVGFRALQAVGGGAMVPIAMAVVGHNFPAGKRALALGIIGASGEAGGVLGPLYGSLIGQYIGWRAIFYLNIPLVLVIVWLLWRYVDESKRYKVAIDYRSAALMALGLGLTTLGVSGGREAGWYGFGLPLVGLGLALIIAFIFSDLRSEHPLVNFQLFSNRSFASANIAHFLVGIALITALVQVPSFAYSSGWPASSYSDPMTGGLLLIRLTLMIPAGAIVGGLLCGRVGGRLPAVFGFVLSAFGLWRMSLWDADVGAMRQTLDLLIAGFGFGLVIAPISLAVVNSVKRRRMASASAVLTTSRIIGMMVGLAALNSWGISKFQQAQEADPAPVPRRGMSVTEYLEELKLWEHHSVETILGVLSDFFLIAAVVCVIAIIPSLLLFRKDSEPY